MNLFLKILEWLIENLLFKIIPKIDRVALKKCLKVRKPITKIIFYIIYIPLIVFGAISSLLFIVHLINLNGIDRSQYNFEEGIQGWRYSNDSKSGRAITGRFSYTGWAAEGNKSLQLDTHFNGSIDGYRKAEVFVDIHFCKPAAYKNSDDFKLDLSNKTIKANVCIPTDLAPRDPSKPLFINFFCIYKDKDGVEQRDDFPDYTNSISSSGEMFIKAKCDSKLKDVIRIGIKIGLSDGVKPDKLNPVGVEPDRNEYAACSIYIDAVDWSEPSFFYYFDKIVYITGLLTLFLFLLWILINIFSLLVIYIKKRMNEE